MKPNDEREQRRSFFLFSYKYLQVGLGLSCQNPREKVNCCFCTDFLRFFPILQFLIACWLGNWSVHARHLLVVFCTQRIIVCPPAPRNTFVSRRTSQLRWYVLRAIITKDGATTILSPKVTILVRVLMQPKWKFADLQRTCQRRFGLSNINTRQYGVVYIMVSNDNTDMLYPKTSSLRDSGHHAALICSLKYHINWLFLNPGFSIMIPNRTH